MNTPPAPATRPIEPCDPAELRILRGLLGSAAACRWFEDMGVGLTVFADRRCRVLAAWAVQHDCNGRPPLVTQVLSQAGENQASMGEWLAFVFGPLATPTAQERRALEDIVAARTQEAKDASRPADVERADRRLSWARAGLATFDRIAETCAAAGTPEQLAASAQADLDAMREACRELAPRWFPTALREAATYYERAGVKGSDPADGLAYLDMLLGFIRGEIG